MPLEKDGVIEKEELEKSPGVPSEKRLKEGPVAVIECIRKIPCDPCVPACPHGAIRIAPSINDIPELLEDKCTGCGSCIPVCPGLAIFLVDENYSETESLVSLPYELLPFPEKGDAVELLNRRGKPVGKGTVARVLNQEIYDKTAVVTLAVPKGLAMEVRGFRIL
jgi:Fe-S-cluster-containing hydrogenase component 2